MIDEKHSNLMEIALKEAKKSFDKGEVPVGCVIVLEGKIIAKAHNLIQSKNKVTKHAEIICLEKAMSNLGAKYLPECELYVTLEPCPMCAGAIVLSKIKKVYIATKDPKSGSAESIFNILNNPKLNHRCQINWGIKAEESSRLLKDFFKELREKKK
jgi:tRNA(adenine34) deaminase